MLLLLRVVQGWEFKGFPHGTKQVRSSRYNPARKKRTTKQDGNLVFPGYFGDGSGSWDERGTRINCYPYQNVYHSSIYVRIIALTNLMTRSVQLALEGSMRRLTDSLQQSIQTALTPYRLPLECLVERQQLQCQHQLWPQICPRVP